MENTITVARFYIENGDPKVEFAEFEQTTLKFASRLNAVKLPFKGMKQTWWVLTSLRNAAVDLTVSGITEDRNVWGEVERPAAAGKSRPVFRLYDYEPREGVEFVSFAAWRVVAVAEREEKVAMFPDEGFPEIPEGPPQYVWEGKSVTYGNKNSSMEFT